MNKQGIIQFGAPAFAALFYGGWATYCNWAYDMKVALTAGLVQGGFAFTSTLILTSLVLYLLKRNNATFTRVFAQSSFPLVTIPALLHFLAGTPNILAAMLPGLVVGHIYLWGLIKKLSSHSA